MMCDYCEEEGDVYFDKSEGVAQCVECCEKQWEITYNKYHAGEYGKNKVKF